MKRRCSMNDEHYPHRWALELGYAGHGGFREEYDCDGESLPLDPNPWRVTDKWGAVSRYPREITTGHSTVVFYPRPQYEQRRERYDDGSRAGSEPTQAKVTVVKDGRLVVDTMESTVVIQKDVVDALREFYKKEADQDPTQRVRAEVQQALDIVAEVRARDAVIEAVRKLHVPEDKHPDTCRECSSPTVWVGYPCATIRALGGDQ